MANYIFVLAVGLAAGALSGIIGTVASIMLLPVLVFQFGPKQAVPIMAIAVLMSNIAKVLAWWREVDWRAFAAYSTTGIPAAAFGARTLLVLPPRVVDLALGLFFRERTAIMLVASDSHYHREPRSFLEATHEPFPRHKETHLMGKHLCAWTGDVDRCFGVHSGTELTRPARYGPCSVWKASGSSWPR